MKNMTKTEVKSFLFKSLIIILGSIISAYGITLAIFAGFGGATLAVLWVGVCNTFNISIGTASFIVAVIMIAFVFFYDKKQIHIGTVIYQVVYSFSVGVFTNIQVYTNNTILNFIIMLLGIVIFAVGTGLYASANLGRGSYEAVTFALADKNKWQVKKVRMILDISVVVIGLLLGGQFGLCTICTVFMSGFLIQKTVAFINKHQHFM